MIEASKPHSELRNKIIGELRRDPVDVVAIVQALDDLIEQLEAERAASAEWGTVAGEATVRVKELEEQLEACRESNRQADSNHAALIAKLEEWNSEARRRLYAAEKERDVLLAQLQHADGMCARSFGACFDRSVLNPASRPCEDCDGVGAQAGAHTERVEPCPACGGSGVVA